MGRTDGEAPEHGWENINAASGALKEMGPGSHRDALDDLLNDCNWEKVVGMGQWLVLFITLFDYGFQQVILYYERFMPQLMSLRLKLQNMLDMNKYYLYNMSTSGEI